jgi:hypothetical protein
MKITEAEIEAAMAALLDHPFEYSVEAGGRYDEDEVRATAVAVLEAAARARGKR